MAEEDELVRMLLAMECLARFCRELRKRSAQFVDPRFDRLAYLPQQLSDVVLVVKRGQDAVTGIEQAKQLVGRIMPGQFHCVVFPPSRDRETRYLREL